MSDDSFGLGFGTDLLIVDDDETFLEQEKLFLKIEKVNLKNYLILVNWCNIINTTIL